MRKTALLIAAMTILAAAPAAASNRQDRPKDSNADKPAASIQTASTTAGPTYCIDSDERTDSRIHSRECKTKAEWTRLGVEIDETTKK
ncbi:MAG: hypothetical protein ACJ8FT_08465 [Sphingomonas sp.]